METSILIAEMFLKEAKKDIKEKKIQIADFKLKKAISIFNDLILKNHDKLILAKLYINRANAYNELINTNNFNYESNYFLDIKSSCAFGNENAKKKYESEKFQKKFEKYKITFLFDFNFTENEIIDFSSMFIVDNYQNIDRVYISKNRNIKNEFDLNFHKTFDYENYSKTVLRLIHGLLISDNFVCINKENTKQILNKILKTEIIDEIFLDKRSKNIIDEINKFKKSNTKLNTATDCYNYLFKKQLQEIKNSMVNTVLITECYRFISYYNNYPSVLAKNVKVKEIING